MRRRSSATTSAAARAPTAPPATSSPSPDWQEKADAALAAYVEARVRAAGWDDEAVALTLAWLPRRARDTPFVISESRIELQLAGEVRLVLRRFACPDYVAPSGTIRCRLYVDGGGCALPGRGACVEWQRVNASPSPPETRAPSPLPRRGSP